MASLTIYNSTGKKSESLDLAKEVFGVEVNPAAVSEVIRLMQSNSRTPVAHVKDRSEVAGGGRKPWRQKGTGRARHGSIRSPLWRGGGVTFGPSNVRVFTKKINKKARRSAMRMMLTSKVKNSHVLGLDTLAIKEPKTKNFDAVISAVVNTQFDAKSMPAKRPSVLLVTTDDNAVVARGVQNIPGVDVTSARNLNLVSLASHAFILIEKDAVDVLVKRLA